MNIFTNSQKPSLPSSSESYRLQINSAYFSSQFTFYLWSACAISDGLNFATELEVKRAWHAARLKSSFMTRAYFSTSKLRSIYRISLKTRLLRKSRCLLNSVWLLDKLRGLVFSLEPTLTTYELALLWLCEAKWFELLLRLWNPVFSIVVATGCACSLSTGLDAHKWAVVGLCFLSWTVSCFLKVFVDFFV